MFEINTTNIIITIVLLVSIVPTIFAPIYRQVSKATMNLIKNKGIIFVSVVMYLTYFAVLGTALYFNWKLTMMLSVLSVIPYAIFIKRNQRIMLEEADKVFSSIT